MNKLNSISLQETYTASQAAQMLGVTRQTIYKYGKEGILEEIKYPHNLSIRKVYTKESVKRLIEKLTTQESDNNRISITQLSKEWNIERNKLYNIIKSNQLPYVVDREHFSRPTTVISLEVKNRIEEILKEQQSRPSLKHAKLDFSKPNCNIAIYQKFFDGNGEVRRIIRKVENGKVHWGFLVSDGFLPYKKAINYGYRTAYPLSQTPATKNNGYSKFKVPKYEAITFDFLDFLYQECGINNLYIEDLNQSEMNIHVKENEILITPAGLPFTDEWLNEHIIEGEISITESSIIFGSNRKYTTVSMQVDIYTKLQEIAIEKKCSMNELIESSIHLHLDTIMKDRK